MNIHPVHPASKTGLPHSKSQNLQLGTENKPLKAQIMSLKSRVGTLEETITNPILQTIGQPIQKGLALFSKLPPEISRMVWTFAHPAARVITIFESPDGVEGEKIVYSTVKVLTLLHVCQESRQIAKKWYQLTFGPPIGSHKTARIYFDFASDAADIPLRRDVEQNHPNHSAGSPYSISVRTRCKVIRVIQEVSQFSEQFLSTSRYRPAAT
jgi:hypothetical protein